MLTKDFETKAKNAQDLEYQLQLQSSLKQKEREDKLQQERQMPGLYFECYDRDPIMKMENFKTGQIQASQTEIEH